MYRPSAMELQVLKILRELGEADPVAIAGKDSVGPAMVGYLCRYLTEKGLVHRVGKKYALTEEGQRALEEAHARVLAILRAREGEVMETLAKVRLP